MVHVTADWLCMMRQKRDRMTVRKQSLSREGTTISRKTVANWSSTAG